MKLNNKQTQAQITNMRVMCVCVCACVGETKKESQNGSYDLGGWRHGVFCERTTKMAEYGLGKSRSKDYNTGRMWPGEVTRKH